MNRNRQKPTHAIEGRPDARPPGFWKRWHDAWLWAPLTMAGRNGRLTLWKRFSITRFIAKANRG